jgi:membrane protease YdiL (CAAX protease family)
MTLFTDLLNFFRRERAWGLLFVLLLGLTALNLLWPQPPPAEKPSSQMLEELRVAEIKLRDEIRAAGGVQKFFAENPKLLLAFNTFSFLLGLALVFGLFLDFSWLTRSRWRDQLRATGPPEARHWGLATIFKATLLFMALAFGLGLLLSWLKSRFFPSLGANLLSLIHTTVSDLFVIGTIVYFLHRLGGNWRDLGFRGVRLWKDLKVGLAGYLAVLPVFFLVLIAVAFVAYFLSYEPPPHPLVEIFLEEEKRAPGIVVYSVFLACVAGPFLEEIFFRGFCYPAFKKRWGVFWALVLSASFFALIHQNLFAFWPIFVLGFGLGYLYEKRGTLVPSIVLHIVHNSVFITYFFLAKKVLTGG